MGHEHFWDFKRDKFRCLCGARVAVMLNELPGGMHLNLDVESVGAGVELAELHELVEFVTQTAAEHHMRTHHPVRRSAPAKRHRKRAA